MAFKVGAVYGEAILKTAKWTSGAGLIQKSAKKLGGVLATAAKVGFAVLTAALVKSTYEANKFQKTFSNVTTLISDQDENFQGIAKSLLKLDSRLGTTTELTEGLYQALSAGAKDAAAGLVIVEQSAKFAGAALTSNSTAVDVLTTAMNAYGSDVVSAAKASDVFFTTIKQGKITGEQLSSTIGQSIPLFASTGIALEELSSGMAAMTKQGVSASESTTQLNAIVNSFLKPSEKLSESLQNMGYESGSAFLKAEGLAGALKLLEEQTGGDASALAEFLPNIRAMRGAMALTGKGGEEFTAILGKMADASGATEEAFGKQEKTFETFRNELNKSQVIVGNISKFFVDKLAVGAQSALEAINQFLLSAEGLKTFENIASKVGGAFAVLKTFALEVYDLFKDNLFKAIDDITKTFDDLFSNTMEAGDGFNMIAGAASLVGAALNIVLAYAKLVIKGWMNLINIGIQVAKVAGNLWDVLTGKKSLSDTKAAFTAVGEAMANMGKDLVDDTVNVVTTAMEEWDKLADGQKANGEKFEEAWKDGSGKAATWIRNNYNKLVTGVENGNGAIVENFVMLRNEVETETELMGQGMITSSSNAVEETGKNLTTLKDKFKNTFDAISQGVSLVYSGISDISSQFFTNENAKLENSINEENELFKSSREAKEAELISSLEQGLITQSEYDTQKIILEKSLADQEEALRKEQLRKENDIKKKEFNANKATTISGINIAAAAAIMGYWANSAALGPIAGPIFAGIMTGATATIAAIQSGVVAAEQFVPAMAEGGTALGGLTQINENGGELQILKDGTKIVPNDISRDIAEASGNIKNTNININNPVVRNDNDITRIAQAVSRILSREYRTA